AELTAAGKSAREIAGHLGVGLRTVHNDRAALGIAQKPPVTDPVRRERVRQLVVAGHSSARIADSLGITIDAVRHDRRILTRDGLL
ncbi:MAG: hypothetical protein QM658_17770, partial [Gordonia sp. (in: high G+C Gram-positive bacteria)]